MFFAYFFQGFFVLLTLSRANASTRETTPLLMTPTWRHITNSLHRAPAFQP